MMESPALLPPCGKPTRLWYRKGRVEKALVLCHQYYPPLPLSGTLGDLLRSSPGAPGGVPGGKALESVAPRLWPPAVAQSPQVVGVPASWAAVASAAGEPVLPSIV